MKINVINVLVLFAPSAWAAAPGSGAGEGEFCDVRYIRTGNGVEKYQKATTECASHLVCVPNATMEATEPMGSVIHGECGTKLCHGKTDPTDMEEGDIDGSNEATIRVTICHRTCSETNPWVRITIDDDAWNGTQASGCGHKEQHDVRDECSKYSVNNWAAWGANKKDYLIKWHGTREYVRQINGWDDPTTNNGGKTDYDDDENHYWREWERACPYVRNGHCCSWEDGNCCGDDPALKPAIHLKKTAGPPGTCGVDMTQQVDVYLGIAGEPAEYCYHITNDGDTCLEDMTLGDPLIADAISDDTALSTFPGFAPGFMLCPGEDIFVPHPTTVPETPEGPVDGKVEGTQEGVETVVEDMDHATIVPAEVEINKKAGPPGTCGVDMSQQVELYGGELGAEFEWCYTITNTGGVCLKDVTMTDTTTSPTVNGVDTSVSGTTANGITVITDEAYAVAELFCPGETITIIVPSTIPPGGSGGPGTVTGTPDVPDAPPITDNDPAAVVPAAIDLEKFAGPPGTCGEDMSKQEESYEAPVGEAFEYCHVISVPAGGICVNSILMSDPEISSAFTDVPISSTGSLPPDFVLDASGVVGFTDELCAGDTVFLTVPSTVPGPDGEAKEGTVEGTGVVDGDDPGPTVTDKDPAGVSPPDAPPAIGLSKTAGPVGTCKVAMDLQKESYDEASEGEAFEYCYVITNPGAICINSIVMGDVAPSVSFADIEISAAGISSLPEGFTLIDDGFVGFVDELCSGESLYLSVLSSIPDGGEGPLPGTVNGVGVLNGIGVNATDPAAVVEKPALPQLNLKKTAGPPGTCGVDMSQQTEVYPDLLGAAFTYCYEISVPLDAPCVYHLLMKDLNITDSFTGAVIDSANPGVVSSTVAAEGGFVDTMCGGDVVFFELLSSVPGPDGEGPFFAIVSGKGTEDDSPVSATDDAAVVAKIIIQLLKTAGPPGTCGIPMDPPQQVEVYDKQTAGEAFEYCYEIFNPPGGVCLLDILMSDSSISTPFTDVDLTNLPAGMALLLPDGFNFVDELCANEKVFLSKSSIVPEVLEKEDAVVNATSKEDPTKTVSDQDHATVDPMDEIVLPASIVLSKTAGPPGTCGIPMDSPVQAESYLANEGDAFEYCYAITVADPNGACIKALSMADVAPSVAFSGVTVSSTATLPAGYSLIVPDGFDFVDELCAGDTVFLSVASTIPDGGEGPWYATVKGASSADGTPVSYSDPAAVAEESTCLGEMPGIGSGHCGSMEGVKVLSVIGATPSPSDANILWNISPAADGKSVSFRVASPFEDETDIYTKYHQPIGTGGGAWLVKCDGDMAVPDCGSQASEIVANCIWAEGDSFSVIDVFFVKPSPLPELAGGAVVDKCCHEGLAGPAGAIAQYTFIVKCACPEVSRKLRGSV